ncbi:hypothetical protein Pla52n_43570 [Stieleria varia]|uniref:Uncharacterized protein n=1 Tax=Stieleria varia TaxID=2528005 RepID=A0A5C6APE9_9BACT|nr:hypothetical protein Pla52n_43570 [Stieleria varia]
MAKMAMISHLLRPGNPLGVAARSLIDEHGLQLELLWCHSAAQNKRFERFGRMNSTTFADREDILFWGKKS